MLDIIPGDHLTLLDHCTHVWYKIDQVSSSGHFSSNIRGHKISSTTTTISFETEISFNAVADSFQPAFITMLWLSIVDICWCCQSSLNLCQFYFTKCSWFSNNYWPWKLLSQWHWGPNSVSVIQVDQKWESQNLSKINLLLESCSVIFVIYFHTVKYYPRSF